MTKLENSNCDPTQKLKLWPNFKNHFGKNNLTPRLNLQCTQGSVLWSRDGFLSIHGIWDLYTFFRKYKKCTKQFWQKKTGCSLFEEGRAFFLKGTASSPKLKNAFMPKQHIRFLFCFKHWQSHLGHDCAKEKSKLLFKKACQSQLGGCHYSWVFRVGWVILLYIPINFQHL